MKKYLFIIVIFLFVSSCKSSKQYKFQRLYMGTIFTIIVSVDEDEQYKNINMAVDTTFELVEQEEKNIYSMYSKNSELAELNEKLKKTDNNDNYIKVKVSDALYNIFKTSLFISEQTKWSFDITYKPISDLWKRKLSAVPPSLPGKNEIEQVKKKSGPGMIKLLPDNYVQIKNGSSIGLGGIAKGQALDDASRYLKEKGYNNFIINGGGDIKFSGSKGNKAWVTSILNPDDKDKAFGYCMFKGNELSIVTSGSYYRYSEYKGKRYSHIIDPRSGYPTQSDIVSITVISKNAVFADAYATGLYIEGFEKVEQQFDYLDKEGVGVIIINNKGHKKMNSRAMLYCYLTN